MKRVLYMFCLTLTCVSCGSFGEGMMAGMGAMYGGGNYGGGYYSGGNSYDYLLDPRYAIAQTAYAQQQRTQFLNATVAQTISQCEAKEEQEYQEFCRYNRKPDGSYYTKNEWRSMKAQMNSTSSSDYTSSSSSSYSSNNSNTQSSSKYKCAYCNGTGQVVKNDPAPPSFGIDQPKKTCPTCGNWYDPTVSVHYHQKCIHCGGTGYPK